MTAFSVPIFSASCKPEPIFASLRPPPTLGKLPSPFKILSNCADAGLAAVKKNTTVAPSRFIMPPAPSMDDDRLQNGFQRFCLLQQFAEAEIVEQRRESGVDQ